MPPSGNPNNTSILLHTFTIKTKKSITYFKEIMYIDGTIDRWGGKIG